MSDPENYPPPPDQPPLGFEPAPSLPPAATPPAVDYAAFPPTTAPGPHRVSRHVWVVIAAISVVVMVLVGVMAYTVVGYTFASSRISDANGAINSTQSHRDYVNTTLDLLDQQVGSFATLSDSRLGKSLSGQVVSESQGISATVGSNDQALAAARARLNDQQWLTVISSGRLANQASRIDHARKAVATVKSAADDYVLLGQFFQALFQSLIDWGTLEADAQNNDFVGAAGADTMLQADVAKALAASTKAPALPQEYKDHLTALGAYATDVGAYFNARTRAAQDAALKLIDADIVKLNAIDFTGTSAKLRSYYQHYRDDFNTEMDKAIS